MKTKLLALLLLASPLANAGDLELTLGGWSAHFGQPDPYVVNRLDSDGIAENAKVARSYNETHSTFAVKYKNFELGTMENSHRLRSYMLSYIYRHEFCDMFSAGIRIGGATGYPDTPVSPIVHPHIVTYYKAVGVELGWLPDINNNHKFGIFTLSGKVRF